MNVRTLILPASLMILSQLAAAQAPAPEPAPTTAQSTPAAETTPAAGDTNATTPPAEDKRIFGVLPNYRTVEGSQPFSP